MRLVQTILILAMAAGFSGCSEGPSLSTSSIFGGGETKQAALAKPTNTPSNRALQVGTTAARATKCGYNFDAAQLRANSLAYEAGLAPGTDQSSVVKTYDISYSGITKAVANKPGYCTDQKTTDIKAALNRHLAGDYTPDPPKQVAKEEGIFSGWASEEGDDSGVRNTLPTAHNW